MLIATEEYLFTSKLIALLFRKELASRDIYDIYFFAKNNWDIDVKILEHRTKKKIIKYLTECITYIRYEPWRAKRRRVVCGS
jgi:hypothetical protein